MWKSNRKEEVCREQKNVDVCGYVGGVELLLRNLPLCGGGSTYRNEIKRAGGTFLPGNRQGGPNERDFASQSESTLW